MVEVRIYARIGKERLMPLFDETEAPVVTNRATIKEMEDAGFVVVLV